MEATNETKTYTAKTFDFSLEGQERNPRCSPIAENFPNDALNEEEFQIDVQAEFSREFSRNKKQVFQTNSSLKEADEIEVLGENLGKLSSNNGLESAEKKKRSKDNKTKVKNGVSRNKSERGIRLFKRKIFSRSGKQFSTKRKTEKEQADLSMWDDFGREGARREGSLRDQSGCSEEALVNGPELVCQCTFSKRGNELEKRNLQLENENNTLTEEKMELMNSLSNLWIEIEDLKSEEMESFSRDKMGGGSNYHQKCEDSDGCGKKETLPMDNAPGGIPIPGAENLKNGSKDEIRELTIEKEALVVERNMQSEILQSLRIKLSVLSEDKESLSRKLHEMFNENSALKQQVAMSRNGRKMDAGAQHVDKLKDENVSLRSRLNNLENAKVLLEKNNQRLKTDKKKQTLWRLQVEKRCEILSQKIEEDLQNLWGKSSSHVASSDKTNQAVVSSESYERKSPRGITESVEAPVGSGNNANSVKDIVNSLEKSKSSGVGVRARKKILENQPENVSVNTTEIAVGKNNLRRAVTLNEKSSVKTRLAEEITISRFPPTHATSKSRKDLSLKKDEQKDSTQNLPNLSTEDESASLDFLEHLEHKCSFLLAKFKLEWLQNNPGVYEMRTEISAPDANLEDIYTTQGDAGQKDTVLLTCLRNLQKENDKLKIDNLKLKGLVNEMQEDWTESLCATVDNNVDLAEKVEPKRTAENCLPGLEVDLLIPERDAGSSTTGENTEIIEAGGISAVSNGNSFDKKEYDPNHLNKMPSLHREQEKDMSSWHRKYSEKRLLRENRNAHKEKALLAKTLKQDGLSDPKLDIHLTRDVTREFRELPANNVENTDKERHQIDTFLSNDITLANNKQQTDDVTDQQGSANGSAVFQPHRCQSFEHNGPRHRDSSVLARLSRRSGEPKALKKAMSTCGSRDRLYKVHYV